MTMKNRLFILILAAVIVVSLSISCDLLFGNSDEDLCPWCGKDECNCLDEMTPQISELIGEDIYKALGDHITMYEGVNPPPYIDGVFLVYEMETIYCSDNHYEAGEIVQPVYIKLSNRNDSTLTISYTDVNYFGNLTNTCNEAYIRGEGQDFTVYFTYETITDGTYGNLIELTVGIVVSGTYTGYGIENPTYAFIMVDKVNDTASNIMDKGAYRIYGDKDGLSDYTYWPDEN